MTTGELATWLARHSATLTVLYGGNHWVATITAAGGLVVERRAQLLDTAIAEAMRHCEAQARAAEPVVEVEVKIDDVAAEAEQSDVGGFMAAVMHDIALAKREQEDR